MEQFSERSSQTFVLFCNPYHEIVSVLLSNRKYLVSHYLFIYSRYSRTSTLNCLISKNFVKFVKWIWHTGIVSLIIFYLSNKDWRADETDCIDTKTCNTRYHNFAKKVNFFNNSTLQCIVNFVRFQCWLITFIQNAPKIMLENCSV